MVCYKVVHLFFSRKPEYIHCFDIGIYDSKEKASSAIAQLRIKEGFCLRPNQFYTFKVLRIRPPKLLNRTYWVEGFTTYTYTK